MKKIMGIAMLVMNMLSFSYTITPTNFDKVIDRGESGYVEYVVENDSANKVRLKMNFNPITDKEKFDIQIYPKVLFLEPYSEKVVKVLVKEKENLDKPEYKFEMFLSELKIPTVPKENGVKKDTISIGGSVGTQYVYNVMGYSKEAMKEMGAKEIGEFVNTKVVKAGKDKIILKVDNKLSRSIRMTAVLYDNRNSVIGVELPRVSGKSTKDVTIDGKRFSKLKGEIKKIELIENGYKEKIQEIEL